MNNNSILTLIDQLIIDEGCKLEMYLDSKGIETIGVGHNLRDRPISQEAAEFILDDDLQVVFDDLNNAVPSWTQHNEVRQQVLANMCFNMGITKLLGFIKMWTALSNLDYERAADEMVDSKWYNEVGQRAVRLVEMMRTGKSLSL